MNSLFTLRTGKLCRTLLACWLLPCLLYSHLKAQVSPPVTATTHQHNKQVIGYITQWDAWKNIAGIVPAGGYNHLNVDYSQYTQLNFSFFGVAVDGSLHSGDYRNKNIYQVGATQAPAALVNTDIYSSWDMYLLYGELDILYNIADGSYAYSLGYRNAGGGWSNVNTGKTGSFPLSVPKQGGAPGVIDLAHQKGVKVVASIGGWSMCKHYPEMAADATKRARFIAGCQELISMGFDGIDFDWEYPNDPGMNIEHYGPTDYANFAALVEQLRAAIGPGKLITACFAAAPAKLQGFDWARLNNSMNYFDMMTYDYNGGWSNKAGHNAPLYDYPGAEYSGFSLHATTQALRALGVNMSKVNLGAPFYGRGVITNGAATLNGATVKRAETVQPDGPIQTCADYTNWAKDVWDGTPNYSYILNKTGSGSGWTDHWDDVAKVPYKTNGSFFLSYDNERSVGEKAQYIKDNSLAGVIIWQVFGDMLNMTASTQAKGKLIYCPNTTSPLVNKINEVFAGNVTGNIPPKVNLISPVNNTTYTLPATVTLQASASDSDGVVKRVAFYRDTTLLAIDSTAPYSYSWTSAAAGSYGIKAIATDDKGASTTSTVANITVTGGSVSTGKVIVGYWQNWGTPTDASPYIPLRNVNPKYNVIEVAFAMSGTDKATMSFVPENTTPALFAADVAYLQSQSKKVLLSIGGETGTLDLTTTAQKQAFVTSLKALLDQYNFDGFDIDIEGGANLQLNSGDNDFTNPTTPKVVNLIAAIKEVVAYRKGLGKDCWLTMAPETYYVQTAYGSTYGPLVGAYLPVINGLRTELTFIHPQYYNTGSVMGLDNGIYNQATSDFIVAMSEVLLQGFPVSGTGKTFAPLREDQVAFGVPASASAAGGGYTTPVNVKKALDYLIKGQSYGGAYTLRKPAGYPNFRGIMTWSVNWDKAHADEFANNYYDYFFGTTGGNKPPVVNITAPANNTTYAAPATVLINATATDSAGTIVKVEFYNGATLLATDSVAPYSYSWTNVAAGNYAITAKATDNGGASTISSAVNIVVNPAGGGGCDGIAAWGATTAYNGGAQVVYSGKVYSAQWWTQGDQPDLNTGSGKPWKYVRDCGGAPGNVPPTVSITSPANNAAFTAPASIAVNVTAADTDGTIAYVTFYNGTTVLNYDSIAPYSYTWSNVAAGNYAITAKATDNGGASTMSAVVNVVVNTAGGGGCGGIAAWVAATAYSGGAQVVYAGKVYNAKWWTQGEQPDLNTGSGKPWEYVRDCTGAALVAKSVATATLISYPNPTNGNEIRLKVDGNPGEKLLIEVMDLQGNAPVIQQIYVAAAKGMQPVSINISKVHAGTWIIKVTSQQTHKVSSTRFIRL